MFRLQTLIVEAGWTSLHRLNAFISSSAHSVKAPEHHPLSDKSHRFDSGLLPWKLLNGRHNSIVRPWTAAMAPREVFNVYGSHYVVTQEDLDTMWDLFEDDRDAIWSEFDANPREMYETEKILYQFDEIRLEFEAVQLRLDRAHLDLRAAAAADDQSRQKIEEQAWERERRKWEREKRHWEWQRERERRQWQREADERQAEREREELKRRKEREEQRQVRRKTDGDTPL